MWRRKTEKYQKKKKLNIVDQKQANPSNLHGHKFWQNRKKFVRASQNKKFNIRMENCQGQGKLCLYQVNIWRFWFKSQGPQQKSHLLETFSWSHALQDFINRTEIIIDWRVCLLECRRERKLQLVGGRNQAEPSELLQKQKYFWVIWSQSVGSFLTAKDHARMHACTCIQMHTLLFTDCTHSAIKSKCRTCFFSFSLKCASLMMFMRNFLKLNQDINFRKKKIYLVHLL